MQVLCHFFRDQNRVGREEVFVRLSSEVLSLENVAS